MQALPATPLLLGRSVALVPIHMSVEHRFLLFLVVLGPGVAQMRNRKPLLIKALPVLVTSILSRNVF